MPAPDLPSGCTGDCDEGTSDCTCGHAFVGEPITMWDLEEARPRLAWLLYGAALGLGLLSGWLTERGLA